MENSDYSKIFRQFSKYIDTDRGFSAHTRFNYSKIIEYYLDYLMSFNINSLNDAEQDIMVRFAKFRGEKEYATAYVNLRFSALKTFYT